VPLAISSASATQLRAAVPANLITNAGTVSVTVVNPDGASSGAASFTITPLAALPSGPGTSTNPPPQVPRVDPEVESVKSVLAEYAAAYSRKDYRKVFALFPGMSREDRSNLQDAFSRGDYRVSYTIEIIAPPVIKGDEATVSARTVARTVLARTERPPVTKNVVISLTRAGGQWTISSFR
jgi:hypothetical protein